MKRETEKGKTVDELRLSVSTTILLLVSSAFIGRILYDGRYGLSGVYAALTVSPEKQPSYYYKYLFIYYYYSYYYFYLFYFIFFFLGFVFYFIILFFFSCVFCFVCFV